METSKKRAQSIRVLLYGTQLLWPFVAIFLVFCTFFSFFPFYRVSLSRFNFIPRDNPCEWNVISLGESFKKSEKGVRMETAISKRDKHLTRGTGWLALMVMLLYFTFLDDVCTENVQFYCLKTFKSIRGDARSPNSPSFFSFIWASSRLFRKWIILNYKLPIIQRKTFLFEFIFIIDLTFASFRFLWRNAIWFGLFSVQRTHPRWKWERERQRQILDGRFRTIYT